ncbi:MAG TPA: DUF2520 domain-containing protein [Acidimicrobiia bacterium]|nr:DUF2520 domain-containing protein [Acidimicrobiia bacterium]
MDLVVIGAGRAGGSLARAAAGAGHRVVGVLSRKPQRDFPALEWEEPLPDCDLAIVAVSDSAITEVADRLRPYWNPAVPAVHVSGFVPVDALAPIGGTGAAVGSFHPLQTLPDPVRGAAALSGAWAAITAAEPLAGLLEDFAESLGMRPFALADDAKPLYHAAAAAAANYVVEALGVASDLLDAAHVDMAVMEPLTRRVVENVFAVGSRAALTGPIARGDLDTVRGQMRAADGVSPELGEQFRLLARATAIRAGVELE